MKWLYSGIRGQNPGSPLFLCVRWNQRPRLERERIAGGSIIQARKNRPMDRNNGYDASDPLDQVAVIYTVFMCQSCSAIYNPHTNENELLPYHVVGQGARGAGWLAEPFMNNWRVLCPSCSKLRATQK